LYHHFLDLFELLEAVSLHFLELLLLRNKHIQAGFLLSEEGMRDALSAIGIFSLDRQ
jgi:hypothetical protein